MSSTVYHEDKEFKNIDYSEKTLRDRVDGSASN